MKCVMRSPQAGLALLAVGFGLWILPAGAEPTAAQQEAIKSSCRSDYMSNCMSVKPGGIEALQCLERNMSKLSGACKSAVSAVTAKAEPAPATPAAAQAHTAAAPEAASPAPAPAPAAPAPKSAAKPSSKSAAVAPAATKAGQPTQAQQNAIRSACATDFRSKCAGVSPGGEAALACLQKNSSTLSSACRTAVNAVGGTVQAAVPASATAAATPQAAAVTNPAPPAPVVATLPPLMESRILRRFCSMDYATLCKDVPIGEGRVLQCLAQNTPALSPACKQAMATTTR